MKDSSYKKSKKHSKKSLKGGDSSTVVVSDTNNFAHIEPIQAKPLEVVVYNNAFDKALRAFRALVQKERILSVYKEKQTYEKPSDRRRRKRNEMKRKLLELNSTRDRSKGFKKPFKNKKADEADSEQNG